MSEYLENYPGIFYEKNINHIDDLSNFITKKIIKGNIKVIKDPDKEIFIKDKIILIENADPGYDFIFTKNMI